MRRSNIVIGILSIVWGVAYALYLRFFPQSVYDYLGERAFGYSLEEIEKYKIGLQTLIGLILIAALVFLIALCVAAIINCRKQGLKIRENNLLSHSVKLIIAGVIAHLIGGVGVAWIFVVVSGILAIIYNPGI